MQIKRQSCKEGIDLIWGRGKERRGKGRNGMDINAPRSQMVALLDRGRGDAKEGKG